MESIKDLFNKSTLTYEEFIKKAKEKGCNIVDLALGGYVSKGKHDKLSGERDSLKIKYDELRKAIDGENGYKEKIEALSIQLKEKEIALMEMKKISEELLGSINKKRWDFAAEKTPYIVMVQTPKRYKRIKTDIGYPKNSAMR